MSLAPLLGHEAKWISSELDVDVETPRDIVSRDAITESIVNRGKVIDRLPDTVASPKLVATPPSKGWVRRLLGVDEEKSIVEIGILDRREDELCLSGSPRRSKNRPANLLPRC